MPGFVPPTVETALGRGRSIWSRIGGNVGQSVVKIDGHYTVHPYPSQDELYPLTEGVDYFLGGRDYLDIPEDVATALEADGFTPFPLDGYGEGAYGFGFYGE